MARQVLHMNWQRMSSRFQPGLGRSRVTMKWQSLSESAIRDDSRCDVCPLSRVKAGVAVRIKQLCAAPELQNRLRELGLGEDQIIKLLTSHTNFICQVCDARLAISEQLAQLILVEPLLSTVV
jgi:Fe2+ transport system protein FeoA